MDVKQRNEHLDEPEPACQKPNECGSGADAVETKSITNIYYDCLERIFDFLDIESLLMVAQTCKRLQIAAAAKFGDKHGEKQICLGAASERESIITIQDGNMYFSLKQSLAVVRCFGAKISHLVVCTNNVHMIQYIGQYCSNTLASLEFQVAGCIRTEAFQKPFKNVEKFRITKHCLINQFTNFIHLFPALRHLGMGGCYFNEMAPMIASLLQLEHLQLYIHGMDVHDRHQINALQIMSRLQSLTIWSGPHLTLTMILDAISASPLITKLRVGNYKELAAHEREGTAVYADELNRFAAEHPLVEEIFWQLHRLTAIDAINFIRQMYALKRFGFQATSLTERDRILNELNNVNQQWEFRLGPFRPPTYIELKRI